MLEGLFAEIEEKRRQDLKINRREIPRRNPTASDLSRCARETALSILHWKERPEPDDNLLARFEVGNQKERANIAKLMNLGIAFVEGQQTCDHFDAKGRLILSGHIDGKILYNGQRYPFDHKTVHPLVYARLHSIEDFRRHKFLYKYLHQLWSYCYLNNIETGFLWLDNLLGDWKFIEISLDYQEMENILKRAEAAVDAVEKIRQGALEEETLPEYHGDPTVCRSCVWWKRQCIPPFTSGEGMVVFDNFELAEKIKRRAELDAAASEYDALDREIKKLLKETMRADQIFLIGDYMIRAEEHVRHVKAKAASEQKYLSFGIEKLHEDAVR